MTDTGSSPKQPTAKPSRGLGRGLDALLGDTVSSQIKRRTEASSAELAENNQNKSGIREIPIDQIRANPDQPRKEFSDESLADLANSIKQKGLLQPILVRPLAAPQGDVRYEIVAGERRWRALQKAQIHTVPVLIRSLSDQETAEIALIENIQRVDLNVMEEADAYFVLNKTHARTQQQIADAVGKSRSHVANIMRLLDLPERVRTGVREQKISMGHARALLASPQIESDYMLVLSGKLSVRETEEIVRNRIARLDRKPSEGPTKTKSSSGLKDADTRALERNLAEALGLEVTIEHQKSGKGQVSINYLNLDQLDEVCRRLLGSAI